MASSPEYSQKSSSIIDISKWTNLNKLQSLSSTWMHIINKRQGILSVDEPIEGKGKKWLLS